MPSTRKLLSYLPALATLAAISATGAGMIVLARRVWRSNVDYRGPYRRPLPPRPAAALPRPARRAILIILDGLRADSALTMPTLVALRQQGVAFIARVGQPSLSLPGWTAMLTGAWQEVSGVTSNWYPEAVTIDSVFSLAQTAGLRTAAVGDRAWRQLFGANIDAGRYCTWQKKLGGDRRVADANDVIGPRDYADDAVILSSDAALTAAAIQLWQREQPGFMVLHLSAADNFGHGYGGTSPQYVGGVAHLDRLLRQFLASVDLSDTAVAITSDHGHTDSGGHGGPEEVVVQSPLILAGAGVASDDGGDYRGSVAQVDIAATLCTLLGLPIPAHNQGRPLAEYLLLDQAQQARVALDWLEQEATFYQAYGERLQAAEPISSGVSTARLEDEYRRGEYATVMQAAHQGIRTLRAAARAVRAERLAHERLARLPLSLAVVAAPAAAAALAARVGMLQSAAAGATANLLYTALYFGRGHRWSLSIFRTDTGLEAFFRQRLLDATISNVAASFAYGLLGGGSGKGDSLAYLYKLQAPTLWAISGAAAQAAAFYQQWGTRYEWHLPDYKTAFKFYLDLALVGGYGMSAAAGLAAGLLGRWLRR